MMWWMVVLMSAGLIGLGIGLLVRDVLRPAAKSSQKSAERSAEKSVDRTTTAKSRETATASKLAKIMSPFTRSNATGAGKRAEKASAALSANDASAPPLKPASAPRLPALEKHWPRLRPEIEAAVAAVNQSMAPLGLAIGPPGDATWSLHNQGFGDYRRVLIDRDSIGWLRMELAADLTLTARLRAHEAERTHFSRDCVLPSRRSPGQLEQGLTESLAGVFEYAVARHSDNIKNHTSAHHDASPSPPPQAQPVQTQPVTQIVAAPLTPQPLPRHRPSAAALLVDEAIALVNRAFVEASAELVIDHRHGAGTAPDDRALAIVARGGSVGLMLVEPRADRIEISVGVADPANFEVARRQSQPTAGLTVQVLAEVIATNAWPAIAAASVRERSA
jgi:hypothetical protein